MNSLHYDSEFTGFLPFPEPFSLLPLREKVSISDTGNHPLTTTTGMGRAAPFLEGESFETLSPLQLRIWIPAVAFADGDTVELAGYLELSG
jgi:hypothetical protein